MGDHDIPAFIDYIKNHTGYKNVSVIAHSQGTAVMHYAMSTHKNYFEKNLNLYISLGPISRLTDMNFFL